MGMEVWNDSDERRAEPERRGRIRRFRDWKDVSIFLLEISGAATVVGSLVVLLFSSLGFQVSGSGQAIAAIRAADVGRDSSIAQLRHQTEGISSRLDAVTYLVCVKAQRDDRTIILPRECIRAIANQDPQ